MNPQTSESVDTRILPKYTLYIGPQGAHKAGSTGDSRGGFAAGGLHQGSDVMVRV